MKAILFTLILISTSAFSAVLPPDPWRVIDNQAVQAVGPDWVIFGGTIEDVWPDAVVLEGSYHSPDFNIVFTGRFLVSHFPYQVANRDFISGDVQYTAKIAGVQNYKTVIGANESIHSLEYGKIWTPPPLKPATPEQIAAAKAAEIARKKAAADKTLKWNQDQAASGDAYGQLRMGERYRDGDGVEKDLVKAKEMFEKSAAQGNKDASDALKNLPQK